MGGKEMIQRMNNVLSGGDFWAPNPDGTTQVKNPVTTATYVDFTDVPANDGYGYVAFIDMKDTAAGTPTLKQSGDLVFGSISNGVYSYVRVNFTTTPTSAQTNAKLTLRILR